MEAVAFPLVLGGVGTTDYAAMAVYLFVVLALGVWFSWDKRDTTTYLLGGRRMAWWVMGVSYLVSLLSTISLVAVPGEAYNNGLTMMIRNIINPFFIIITFFIFIRFYFKSYVFTPFHYLEQRFDARVRCVAAGAFWLMRLTYLALVMYSASMVFEGASGWPAPLTIALVGLIGIAYTVFGGLRAVVWTDLTQFIVLAGGLIIAFVVAIQSVDGGLLGAWAYASEHQRTFGAASDPGFYSFDPYIRVTLWLIVLGAITNSLFSNSADQFSIQRLLATKGYGEARKTMYMYVVLSIPTMVMLWLLGMILFSFYGQQPEEERPSSGDQALFHFIAHELPSPLTGLILAAMLAAVMSTLDSGINSLATILTKDFYLRLMRRSASETQQVMFSRLSTGAIGVFAVLTAIGLWYVSGGLGETIFEALSVWLTIGAVLAPLFLLGVTTRRLGASGALTAVIAGWVAMVPTMAWYFYTKADPELPTVTFMLTSVPSFLTTLIVGYGLNLLSWPQTNEKIDDLTLFTLKPGSSPEQIPPRERGR